ncbi:MAG TPA: polyprenyl synthetase family protein [Gemmatimonadales bacterium]|nr:polyprenyl synthetase family protein [Gemmatimonadales bacterium]
MTTRAERGLEAYLAAARARVDAVLAEWGNRLDAWVPTVAEVVRYALLGAGKRLRPTLVLAAHEALGGTDPAVAQLAAAVEVVHAYSLVHDDLPCMDDDDLRRGRPTAHRAFDVPTATRAGFHMVALAARVLAQGMEEMRLSPARRREIALVLFRAAGAGGMIGGQWLDLETEGRRVPREALEEVHRRKTGGLIAASCLIGGLAVGDQVPPAQLAALRGYGEAVGLAFQIADDVLDATATSQELGKTAGKDAARAKATFVTLLGVGPARAEAERLAARAVARLRDAGLVSPTLVELAHYVVTRPS